VSPGAETQETIETEARDNPRPGGLQPYKPTRDGQSREMGSDLLRVSGTSTRINGTTLAYYEGACDL